MLTSITSIFLYSEANAQLFSDRRHINLVQDVPIAIAEDNVYVAWWSNKSGNNEVMFRASNDNGTTFGEKINLSNTTDSESEDVEIQASRNSVYVTWWERNQTTNDPVMRISTDGGKTFGPLLKASMNGTIFSSIEDNFDNLADNVYTTQRKDNSIFDLQQNVTMSAGNEMTYVDVTNDGSIVASTSSSDNETLIFNGTNGELIKKIKVGDTPKGVKITPDKKYIFVANELSGSVSIISLKDLKVIKEIEVGPIPHNIVFSPDGKKAYLTIQGGDKIIVIDTTSFEKINELPVSKGPHNLDITSDGKLLFVSNAASSDVAVINTTSNQILKKIPVSMGHHGIDVSPDDKRVYVAGIGSNRVNVIDAEKQEPIKDIIVGKGPHGIRTSSDGKTLFVDITNANKIIVIDTDELKVTKQIPTGNMPFWLAVSGNN
ncbi:cytochrome D1 domain-containing protein [Candidatus Nitrosocosmicus franklandus]|nr:cytochrome D1 domain-containing protein [Candidatus Nitrosocosmicus franklandus]